MIWIAWGWITLITCWGNINILKIFDLSNWFKFTFIERYMIKRMDCYLNRTNVIIWFKSPTQLVIYVQFKVKCVYRSSQSAIQSNLIVIWDLEMRITLLLKQSCDVSMITSFTLFPGLKLQVFSSKGHQTRAATAMVKVLMKFLPVAFKLSFKSFTWRKITLNSVCI